MDPNVAVEYGLQRLVQGDRPGARAHAECLFDWLCRGGFLPADREGASRLLHEFGMELFPTTCF